MSGQISPERPIRYRPGLFLLIPLLCLPVACSDSGLHSVRGTVTHKGTPIKGAVIFFHPKGGDLNSLRPSAVTASDGSFSLTTGQKDGAPAGQYAVTVIWPEEPKDPGKIRAAPDETSPKDRLGGRYRDPKSSNLSATVNSGSNRLDPFDLK